MFKILRSFFVFLLTIYKKLISPFLPSACIYSPSCSEYSKEAILKYGIIKGLFLSFLRILRCNPLFKGGNDSLTEDLTIRKAFKKYKEFCVFNKH